MALSLFDHERRLHDLEVGFRALLDLLIIETPASRISVEEAARTLHVRGETGAARLLMQAGRAAR
jgi:hypothetical protein